MDNIDQEDVLELSDLSEGSHNDVFKYVDGKIINSRRIQNILYEDQEGYVLDGKLKMLELIMADYLKSTTTINDYKISCILKGKNYNPQVVKRLDEIIQDRLINLNSLLTDIE